MKVKDQVLLKIKLENIFKKDINKIFSLIVKEYRNSIKYNNNNNFNVSDYKQLIRFVLEKHYKRVHKKFRNIDNKFTKQDVEEYAEQNINILFSMWMIDRLDKVTDEIIETTIEDTNRSIIKAQSQMEESNIPELAIAASLLLRRSFINRSKFIATVETQGAAESTKLIEKQSQEKVIKKRWITVGDSRVRDAHNRANGQEQLLNEPFKVGGELLMYPGDRSLGASIGNIANCRCSQIFI